MSDLQQRLLVEGWRRHVQRGHDLATGLNVDGDVYRADLFYDQAAVACYGWQWEQTGRHSRHDLRAVPALPDPLPEGIPPQPTYPQPVFPPQPPTKGLTSAARGRVLRAYGQVWHDAYVAHWHSAPVQHYLEQKAIRKLRLAALRRKLRDRDLGHLARTVQRLEARGLVETVPRVTGARAGFRLTSAGLALAPTLARKLVPQAPAPVPDPPRQSFDPAVIARLRHLAGPT